MNDSARRRFLQYATAVATSTLTGVARGQDVLYRELGSILDLAPGLPTAIDAVASVFELERLAERVLPPAHFGYIYSGAGRGASKQANLDAFTRWDIVPRRLRGMHEIDLSIDMFGERWDMPFFLSPTSGHMAFHPEAERASARGASQARVTQMLSSLTSVPVEAINSLKDDRPVWYQLYPTNDEAVRYEIVRRVEAAGCPAIVVTVDDIGGRGSEISAPFYNADKRDCTLCHDRTAASSNFLERKIMFSEYRTRPGFSIDAPELDFDGIRRLRDNVKGRLFVKGIMHPADAIGCAEAGADGILVSNHGGRVEDGGLGTLDALPAIAAAVSGRLKIFLDGGVRRGTDVFKALALGADAVGFGRPYCWGLASFGAAGVARSVELVRADLRRAMIQAGVGTVAGITAATLASG